MKQNNHQEGLFVWTKHSQAKMKQYMLSESRVKRVIKNPLRVEEGIAPKTLASMQKAGSKKHPYEIWVMYIIQKSKIAPSRAAGKAFSDTRPKRLWRVGDKNQKSKIKIISAWKYPGVTQPGEPIPIPPDIFEEIIKFIGVGS